MKFRTMIIAAAALVAAAGFAQLSMAKADWARGPVQFLMTTDELSQWKAVKSDTEADQFIALFWARRDPTPGTPRNEFREDFETRVQYADQHFSTSRQRGSLTDRGKVLVLFGAPTRAVRTGGSGGINRPTTPGQTLGAAGAAPGTEAEDTSSAEQQLWIYEGALAEKNFGAPRVELRFIDRAANQDFRMETPRVDFGGAQQRVIAAAITQPNLTSVPTYQQQPQPAPAAATQTAPAPAPAVPTTELHGVPAALAPPVPKAAGRSVHAPPGWSVVLQWQQAVPAQTRARFAASGSAAPLSPARSGG